MLMQADIIDSGVMDSLHDRFQALDEDGSGCLTAADLKMEPLGLKPTCRSCDVSDRASAWQRAILGVSSRATSSSRWNHIRSRSSSRQEASFSGNALGFSQMAFRAPVLSSPPLPFSPPQEARQPRSLSSRNSDVNAVSLTVTADDYSMDRELNISVVDETQSLSFDRDIPKRRTSGTRLKTKRGASLRSPDRFVDEVSTSGLSSSLDWEIESIAELPLKRPSESESGSHEQKFKREKSPKKSTIRRNSKSKPPLTPTILLVEAEGREDGATGVARIRNFGSESQIEAKAESPAKKPTTKKRNSKLRVKSALAPSSIHAVEGDEQVGIAVDMKQTTIGTSKAESKMSPAILSVELEGIAPDSPSKLNTLSRSSSNSNLTHSISRRNSRASSPNILSSRPPSRRPSGSSKFQSSQNSDSDSRRSTLAAVSSAPSASSSRRQNAKLSTKSRASSTRLRPKPQLPPVVGVEARHVAAVVVDDKNTCFDYSLFK